jgi:hypothetical protein
LLSDTGLIFWAGCGRDVDKELIGVDEPK